MTTSSTMTQILLTSKPSRSISTLTITRGALWRSTLKSRSRTGAHSFSPNSAFLPSRSRHDVVFGQAFVD